MTRALATLLGALLASCCANPSKTGPTTGPTTGASVASAPMPSVSFEKPAAPPPVATAPSSAEPSPAAPAPASEASVSSRFEGCLTEADPEATATRSIPKPDRVEVETESGAIHVAHHLNHACCLQAQTRVEQAGQIITLVEKLSGTPCRCRCASVIRSVIAAPSGGYELRLRLEQPSGVAEAHHQNVTVSDAPSKPKLPPKIKVNLDAPKP